MAFRLGSGLSAEEIARRAGISRTALYRFEKGELVKIETLEKLSGYQQIRGRLRAVMKSVEYPEGYFYVERTLALLFGLVAQLSPKLGLPGLVVPHASKLFMRGFTPSPTPAPKSEGY